jgi:hypothetical protein
MSPATPTTPPAAALSLHRPRPRAHPPRALAAATVVVASVCVSWLCPQVVQITASGKSTPPHFSHNACTAMGASPSTFAGIRAAAGAALADAGTPAALPFAAASARSKHSLHQ